MKNRKGWQQAGAVALALALWQLAATLLRQDLLLVPPTAVLKRLLTLVTEPAFLATVGFSFTRIIYGFFLSLVSGTILAFLAGRFPFVETLFWPFVSAVKAVPLASFIILCLIWLSAGNLAVFIAFLMSFPLIYTNVLEGIKSTDDKMLEMAQLFRLSWAKKVKYIYLPHLKPYLLSACAVGIGLAWKAGVAAEVLGIPSGSIGEKLYEAKVYLSTADLFAWTVIIIAISIAFEKLFSVTLQWLFMRLERS